ncbi:MAG: nickel pincer cofactor biosynthesis protein LarC [Treponema sp.]|nr:nickel pincer cofactor biosynthesis protein LarC [Treponema sp.]
MKTLHFDCFAGISGDMTLGALVDLEINPDTLRTELGKLGLDGWELRFERDQRGGITGTHAVVVLGDRTDHLAVEKGGEDGCGSHDHTHGHTHDHGHTHCHDHTPHDGHSNTTWKDIRAVIQGSSLSEGAKSRALDIFTRIAEAEARVHGTAAADVAFHEVGALDSIIDIVGAAICLDLLKPDRITCSEVELGGGMVRCAHGMLPVPAPATVILTRGMPVKTGGFPKEMTTPTGAAILASCVDEFTGAGSFRELKTGYGIGTRKMDGPNLLRVSWREERDASAFAGEDLPWKTEELILMEANIDDMSGEALGFLMERLFAAGALDVTFTSCVMKKSRPGTIVSVLSGREKLCMLRETLFRRSTTIGFRETTVRRLSLKREEERLGTESGDSSPFSGASRKTVYYGAEKLRSKIEFEDRAQLAREQGISLEEAERIIKDGFAEK